MEVVDAMPIEATQRFDGIEIWETLDLCGTTFAAHFPATLSETDADQFVAEAWMMHDALEQAGYIGRQFFCLPDNG